MKTVNNVELLGYVGNPEVIIMKNGTELIKCSLATHESFKTKVGAWETETTWHRIIFWNNRTTWNLLMPMLLKIFNILFSNIHVPLP